MDDSSNGRAGPPGGRDRFPEADFRRIPETSLFIGISTLCAAAVRLTGADGAAVAVLTSDTSTRELVYATDAVAQQLDELQFVVGEGPCLTAYRDNRAEIWPELGAGPAAERWPALTPEMLNLGVRATFAFPVPGARRPIGVLELYSKTVGALAEGAEHSAAGCALAIGKALQTNWQERVVAAGGVESALERSGFQDPSLGELGEFSRSEVYVASGMAAVQLGVSAEQGLDRLRAYTYAQGRPITEVAADIVARRLSLRDQRDIEGHG
ncbi:GAF and ANTAR domain-containing protein [Nocardia sp. XZ_19_385]|uniref:GAF and ANTAR domain-containing protein n=1 Tax=Nocardia sp. XZ_19_385 TaxID=2769488 RepID=UPI00188DCAA1|nr:GAF and ANTAR domain-containing protein [Nocardia sp. XZ_19_385]